jgi:cysteine-rich repeat protein
VVGENVLPPYYANPGTGHPDIPDDSCNPSPGFPENFAGTTIGLDNDGDGSYDESDPDCGPQAVCGNGRLEPGEECDDGNTADGDCCSSTCQYEASGSTCDDGFFCNVGETCDGAGTCGGGSPLDCSDGIGCTVDSCDDAADQCVHAPNDAVCDDGLFCTGVETCSVTSDCQAGTPVDCDDADICTDDDCDDVQDRCENLFDPTNDPTCAAACPDLDDDGFSSAGDACGPVDCDDSDPTVNPEAPEVCDDDKDNDCDGRIDSADQACGGEPTWSVRPCPLVDPEYAWSVACATCHPSQFESWSGSLHARMMIRPGDAQAAGFPLPDDSSVPGTIIALRSWSDVLFVLGQKWRSIWVDRSGEVQGAQWNYGLGTWSPQQGGDYECGACHTTGYDPGAPFELDGSVGPAIVGSWVEYNIGCEACHGPGADHAASPRKDNINRITLDWSETGEGVLMPAIRSSRVCGNCHYRNDHSAGLDAQRRSRGQFNDWSAGPHASSLQPPTLNTYCAKCHSPGNATADSEEHYFTYFEATEATHVACVACHDPHKTSDARWQALRWPSNGLQDPADYPAAVARYRGTDDDPATHDHTAVPSRETNTLCTSCHTMQPGFRRHVDASPPAVVSLNPPYNGGEPFVVPHMEHIEEGNAECVDCHMPPTRSSINRGDVRSHTGLPNEVAVGGSVHFDTTCGQCHDQAQDCVWCHGEFARQTLKGTPRFTDRPIPERPERRLPKGRDRSP